MLCHGRYIGPMRLAPVSVKAHQLIWRAIRTAPGHATLAIAGSTLWAVMTVVWSYQLGRVMDSVIVPAMREQAVPTQALIHGIGVLLAIGIFNGLGVYWRRFGSYTFILKVQADHRTQVAKHYLKLPLAWYRAHPAGDLISRVASDGVSATSALPPFAMAMGLLVMLGCGFAYIGTIDLVILAFTLAMIPTLMVLNHLLNVRMSALAKQAVEAVGDLTGAINESIDAALAIKVLGRGDAEVARITPLVNRVRDRRTAMAKLTAFWDLVFQGLPFLMTFVVLAIGVIRMGHGAISPGEVVSVAYLLGMINTPLRVFGFFLQELPKSLAGLGRIDAVLNVEERVMGGDAALPAPGVQGARVELDHLSYTHHHIDEAGDTQTPGVRDISFTIEPGETIAIVGRTGSGKSTLINLLAGLLPADSGEIRIDGTPIDQLDPTHRTEVIGAVFQAPFLFNESLYDNLTLGALVPEPRLDEAMDVAQISRFVHDVGLDTPVGERGTQLSGGQRQRIALARALLRHPRLLLLDDATSAVDASVEAAILEGLREVKAADHALTTVIVAYRTGSIALADRVVVMADGQIRAVGTHEELLANDPGYVDLLRAVEAQDQ